MYYARGDIASRSFAAILLLAVFLAIDTTNAQPLSPEAILDAWNKYAESLQSLRLECEIERVKQVVVRSAAIAPTDPYAPASGQAKEIKKLNRTMMICMAGDRLLCLREGENWDARTSNTVIRKRTAVFNGKHSRVFYPNDVRPLGAQTKGPELTNVLANHAEINPVHYATDPQTLLERNGYDLRRAYVTNEHAIFEGHDSIEIEVPHKETTARAIIVVDSIASFRIASIREVMNGVAARDVSLSYEPHPDVGWILNSWRSNYFNREGVPSLTISGRVSRAVVNEPIADSEFELTFPAGTHVEMDERYYEADGDGSLSEITVAQYGRPSSRRIAPRSRP